MVMAMRVIPVVLCSALAVVSTMSQGLAEDAAQVDGWSVSISPYVWGAGLEGKVKPFPRAPTADVDVSFKDILKNLDIAGMAIADVRYRRFGAYADLIYTSISADADTPFGILFDDVDAKNKIFVGTFGGAYRAIDTEQAWLDLLVGARVWSVDTELKLDGGLLPDRKFEDDEEWVDPIVGLKGLYRFDNGIFLTSLLQVGGFGAASDLTWDALGAVGYQFNDTISAAVGYRHMEVDYRRNDFVFDVELSGPVIGMVIRF